VSWPSRPLPKRSLCLREVAARRQLVLLTATRDVEHSGAAVLRDVIDHQGR
jgi:uncharacterized protein YeaO (DUF488 family)